MFGIVQGLELIVLGLGFGASGLWLSALGCLAGVFLKADEI